MSFGICSRCRTDGPLWPGTGICDDCHYDDQREDAELARDYDDPYAEVDELEAAGWGEGDERP